MPYFPAGPEEYTKDEAPFEKFSKGACFHERAVEIMKIAKINQNRDFRLAYSKGKYAAHPLLVTYVVKNRKNETRIGITASKKVGNAVKRNRARRIITAAFLPLEQQIKKGYDIVLVARTKTPLAKSTQIAPVLQKHLQKLGLMENDQKMDALDDPDVPEIPV